MTRACSSACRVRRTIYATLNDFSGVHAQVLGSFGKPFAPAEHRESTPVLIGHKLDGQRRGGGPRARPPARPSCCGSAAVPPPGLLRAELNDERCMRGQRQRCLTVDKEGTYWNFHR